MIEGILATIVEAVCCFFCGLGVLWIICLVISVGVMAAKSLGMLWWVGALGLMAAVAIGAIGVAIIRVHDRDAGR